MGKFSGGGKGVDTGSLTGELETDGVKKELDCVNAVVVGGKGVLDVSEVKLLVVREVLVGNGLLDDENEVLYDDWVVVGGLEVLLGINVGVVDKCVTSTSGCDGGWDGSTIIGCVGENPGVGSVENRSNIGFGEYPSFMAFAENQVPGIISDISARLSCNTETERKLHRYKKK